MKATLAILTGALLFGCTNGPELPPGTELPRGVEVVVVEAPDYPIKALPDESASSLNDREFPRDGDAVYATDDSFIDREFPRDGDAVYAAGDSASAHLPGRSFPRGPDSALAPEPRHKEDPFESFHEQTRPSIDEQDLDPCQCEGAHCLENWIDENLGCDICVVFRCDDEDALPTVCNMC